MGNATLLGIDIAKIVFQLHGIDSQVTPMLEKRLTRDKPAETLANLPLALL